MANETCLQAREIKEITEKYSLNSWSTVVLEKIYWDWVVVSWSYSVFIRGKGRTAWLPRACLEGNIPRQKGQHGRM